MEREYPETYDLIYSLIESLGQFEIDNLDENDRHLILATYAKEEDRDCTPDLVYFDKEMSEAFFNLISNKGNIRYLHIFQSLLIQSIYLNSKKILKEIISGAYSDYLVNYGLEQSEGWEAENVLFESSPDSGQNINIF